MLWAGRRSIRRSWNSTQDLKVRNIIKLSDWNGLESKTGNWDGQGRGRETEHGESDGAQKAG